MNKGLVLGGGLAAVALALGPWLADAGNERQPPSYSAIGASAPAVHASASSPVGGLAGPPGPVAQEAPHSDSYCLTCHGKPSLQTRFADERSLSLYVDAREIRDSAHDLLTCVTCHDNREVCPPHRLEPLEFAAYRGEAAEMCIRCHLAAAGDYAQSVHGRPVISRIGEGATCVDCHSTEQSAHSVARLDDPRLVLAADSVDESCGRCHEKELDSYRQTSHSKVARFGDPERPATCTTCHGDHAVRAVDDPAEPLTAANLVSVCESCHGGADEGFAGGWLGHAPISSLSAGFYYAERTVVVLIVAGLGFGVLHMILDFGRRLADRWRKGGRDPR